MPEQTARLAIFVVVGMLAAGCSTLPADSPDRADVTAREPDLLGARCRTQSAELADGDRELAEVTRQGLVALGRATSECSGTA